MRQNLLCALNIEKDRKKGQVKRQAEKYKKVPFEPFRSYSIIFFCQKYLYCYIYQWREGDGC